MIYFKQFPLNGHPGSEPAARAAMAAARQGKFADMHRLLLTHQEEHSAKDLRRFAKQAGLDLSKFDADFASAPLAAAVAADKQEGIDAGIDGTPALFLNGREYTDPIGAAFINDWIVEELAVNR